MIIKKIKLENYRSHENTEIELSSGINLILGENGKGKSSILEAISRLIFNISDRTGLKTGRDFIRYGENSAKVEIEFIGNDSREYLLKNVFYSKKTGTSVLKDLKTEEEIKDREEVREKLNELCGIKKEYTEVYENIIIAKQNEFINIFKEKAKTREEVFNKIFNTEIYTDMYSSIFKNIEDRYSVEKERIEVEQSLISSNMKDENEILEDLNSAKLEEKKYLTELENLKIEQGKIEKEISFYQDNKKKLENIFKEIEMQKRFEKDLKINLKKEVFRAKQAKRARKLIEETKENYNRYLNFSNELESLKEEIEILDKIEKKNTELRDKNKKISWELNQNTKQIEEAEIEILKLRDIKEDLEKNILNSEAEEQKINIELDNLRSLYSALKDYEETKTKFEEKDRQIKAIDRNKNTLLLEKISTTKEELKIQQGEFLRLEERIRTLDEAQKKLQERVCPFLAEECENIRDKNIDSYFLERISEEKGKKALLKENIKKLEQDISVEESLKIENREYEILEKEILEIVNLLNTQSQNIDFTKYKTRDEIIPKGQELKAERENLKLEEKRAELRNIVANKEKSKKIINSLKEENLLKEEELKINISEIKENISTELEKKNEKKSVLENELKIYQNSYNTYLENINIAKDFIDIINSLNKTIKNIYSLRAEVKNLFFKKEEIEELTAEISFDILKVELQKINSQIIDCNSNLGKLSEKIKNLKFEIEKINNEKNKIKLLAAKQKKIENKLYKTKLIRNNIKGMGLKISKYMLESISLKATDNFRKITGRVERILWTNETFLENGKEKENKYAVYLMNENKKIAFEHLSGGEQVAVAISLRETMTEFFSNSRFIILDEPTNNLDNERKKLLAEYMGEILNNLDQSIIVTHDNTFREMTERIVEL